MANGAAPCDDDCVAITALEGRGERDAIEAWDLASESSASAAGALDRLPGPLDRRLTIPTLRGEVESAGCRGTASVVRSVGPTRDKRLIDADPVGSGVAIVRLNVDQQVPWERTLGRGPKGRVRR